MYLSYKSIIPVMPEQILKYHDKYIWNLQNDKSGKLAEANAEGFRDTIDFEDKKKTNCNQFVIAIIGSSGIYGLRLPFERTIGAQLELILRQHHLNSNVYNFGVPGYTILQAEAILGDWIPQLKPDLVMLNFGYNEPNLCFSRLTDSEFMNLTSYWPFNIELIKKQLIKVNYLSCNFNKRDPINFFLRPRVTEVEYFQKIVNIKYLLQNYSDGEVWVLPILRAKNFYEEDRRYGQKVDNDLQNKFRFLDENETLKNENIKIISGLSKIDDAKYYLRDYTHYTSEGVDKIMDVLAPEVINYLKTKKPKSCH